MTTHTTKTYIKGKYRIKEYYTDQNLWKETKTLIKKKKHLEKFGKSRTWSNPVGAEGGGKPSSADSSKSTTKKKRLTAREN